MIKHFKALNLVIKMQLKICYLGCLEKLVLLESPICNIMAKELLLNKAYLMLERKYILEPMLRLKG